MARSTVHAADLFCGAGGTSSGLALACRDLGRPLNLLAINHWPVAIDTHSANHPGMRHLCANLEAVNPREVVPGGRLQILVASPECLHHSRARGGRPMSDQSRASAWHVLRWAESLYIESILIENVPEFREWGPLGADGRPMVSKKGDTFRAFTGAMESMGYRVEARVLVAADYGDPTTRQRLFVMARRGGKPIRWPEPTHSETPDLFARKRWVPAREVIDWTIPGRSIFGRKHPLASNTLARIAEGLRRFGGKDAEPFLLHLTHGGRVRSVDHPLPTITGAHRGELGLCEPFLLQQQSGGAPRRVSEPVPTVAGAGAIGLVQPFLVPFYGERPGQEPRTHSVDDPVPTLPASPKFGLVRPFLSPYYGTSGPASVDEPMPTVTTKDRFGLVTPHHGPHGLDVTLRMLQPHELAAAMSFDKGYRFTGTKTDQVKQIGNSVPVRLARALCRELVA